MLMLMAADAWSRANTRLPLANVGSQYSTLRTPPLLHTVPSASWSLGDATSTAPDRAATATNSRPSERYWHE